MPRLTRRTLSAGLGALGAGAALGARTAAQGSALVWRPLAPMPAPAQEIYPTVWNDRILVAGGFTEAPDGAPTASDRSFLYDIAADAWSEGPALPAPRHHPQLLVAAGRLWCIGGFDYDLEGPQTGAWRMHATVWSHDDGAWTDGANLPAPRAETVGLVHEGRIHLIGGRTPSGERNFAWNNHADTDEHLVLDPATDRWEIAAPAPTARNSAAGVVLDGRLWVVGGRRVGEGNNAELEVYDPQADRWDGLAPMPQAQGGLAAGVIDGRIVAFGGEHADGVYPETWIYDPARDVWEAGPDMLTPRHGLGGVSVAGRVYAVGGATGPSLQGPSGTLEVLAIA